MEAFEQVTLRKRMQSRYSYDKRTGRSFEQQQKEVRETKEPAQAPRRCYNCGKENHISVNCLMKTENVKCHKCKGRGHFASKCPENRCFWEKL